MRVSFTVGIYNKKGEEDTWHALVPASFASSVAGGSEVRLRERMVERLREVLRRATPAEQELFQLTLGTELVRVSVDAKLEGGRMHGQIPLIVEPRWTTETQQRFVVYHPLKRDAWFICDDRAELPNLANTFVRHFWKALPEVSLNELKTDGKDRLIQIAFSTEPESLLDKLPSRKKDTRMGVAAPRPDKVLRELGVDETARAAAHTLPITVPRSPYRERLG